MPIQGLTNQPTANAHSSAPPPAAVATGKPVQRATPEPTSTPAQAQPPAPVPDKASVAQAVATINKKLEQTSQDVRFSTDESSGRLVVKLVDTKTDTVIRQIPSEEALAISQSIERLQGLLVKQKA
jgi:flagellar protein FlaG